MSSHQHLVQNIEPSETRIVQHKTLLLNYLKQSKIKAYNWL